MGRFKLVEIKIGWHGDSEATRQREKIALKIQTILDQIDLGSIALPEFQRGYVWNRDQVRSLMHSFYYGHPTGNLEGGKRCMEFFREVFPGNEEQGVR